MNQHPETPDTDTGATGADTLVGVLRRASSNGFDTQLIARVDGTVECESCEATSPASSIEPVRSHRLEGASDAADLMLVVEARCPACGTGGVLTMGYGPNATADDEAVLADLDLGGN